MPYTDDGLCIFDVYSNLEVIYEEVRMIDFRNAANNLIRNCASSAGTLAEGGIVTGIGKLWLTRETSLSPISVSGLTNNPAGRSGRIGLIMTSFEPSVRCSTPLSRAPVSGDCWKILQLMPASIGLRWFGRPEDLGVEIWLPWRFASRRSFLSFSPL